MTTVGDEGLTNVFGGDNRTGIKPCRR